MQEVFVKHLHVLYVGRFRGFLEGNILVSSVTITTKMKTNTKLNIRNTEWFNQMSSSWSNKYQGKKNKEKRNS